jgi:hypothetical protein
MLTAEQRALYERNGYLRISGVFDAAEVEALRTELDELVQIAAS